MKAILYSTVVAAGVVAPAASANAQNKETIPSFAVRDGETLLMRYVSAHASCVSSFKKVDSVDVLQGSTDELTFEAVPKGEVPVSYPTSAVPSTEKRTRARGRCSAKDRTSSPSGRAA
jgi:hypothetical protein